MNDQQLNLSVPKEPDDLELQSWIDYANRLKAMLAIAPQPGEVEVVHPAQPVGQMQWPYSAVVVEAFGRLNVPGSIYSLHTVRPGGRIDPPLPFPTTGMKEWRHDLNRFADIPGDALMHEVFRWGAYLALPIGKSRRTRRPRLDASPDLTRKVQL